MTEAEIKERLLKLLVENEKKFDILASYKRYAPVYAHKTVDEIVKILTKAGVDQVEIDKIMEGK